MLDDMIGAGKLLECGNGPQIPSGRGRLVDVPLTKTSRMKSFSRIIFPDFLNKAAEL
jgi:hypothetical protein